MVAGMNKKEFDCRKCPVEMACKHTKEDMAKYIEDSRIIDNVEELCPLEGLINIAFEEMFGEMFRVYGGIKMFENFLKSLGGR